MIDARVFDDLARNLGKLLPPGVSALRDDFEANARASIQTAFSRLDLVTREEFDVQAGVLAATRRRLEELEKRVEAMQGAEPRGDVPQ